MECTKTWRLLALAFIFCSLTQLNASLDDIATLIKENLLQEKPDPDYPDRPSLKLKELTDSYIENWLKKSDIKSKMIQHFPSLCSTAQGWKTIKFLFEEFSGVGNTAAYIPSPIPGNPDNLITKFYNDPTQIPANEKQYLEPGAWHTLEWCEGCPEASTDKRVITHPQSGWLSDCEQSQGLPV